MTYGRFVMIYTNFSLAVIDTRQPFRFLFDDDHDEDNDVGFVTNAMFEHKTVDKVELKTATWYSADTNTGVIVSRFGEREHETVISSFVSSFPNNMQYFNGVNNIDGGSLIVQRTDRGRLIGWNMPDDISDSSNISGTLKTDGYPLVCLIVCKRGSCW